MMEFDYVIIGSGAVGSTLANQLSSMSKVALIDIGNKPKGHRKRLIPAPYVNTSSKDFSHGFSGVFGGLTASWKGKTYLLTEKENKKWPIEYSEFVENSKELALEMNILHHNINYQEKIDDKTFYHRSIRLGRLNLFKYFKIANNKNITCFEKSTIHEFKYRKSNNKITHLSIINISGKKTNIKVNKALILSAGGLGNIPLYKKFLEKILKKKSLNKFNLLEQPHISIGKIRKDWNPRIRKPFKLADKAIATEDCLVVMGRSDTYAFQISDVNVGTQVYRRLETRFKNNIFSNSLILFIRILIGINNKIRKYFFNFRNSFNSNIGSIEIWFEDTKDNNSQVSISSQKWFKRSLDKLNIHYNFSKKNFLTLKSELEQYTNGEIYDLKNQELKSRRIYAGPKPGCSTPIKSNPNKGEVNIDLQINGIENLYTLGLNIFPAIGFTNPTWTLMVLAKRLSKHLIEKYS